MYQLLRHYSEDTQPDGFAADLQQKNWVILIEDDQGKLKGFSTLLLYETQFAGERLTVVYSSDPIVDPSAWSGSVLPHTWMSAIKHLRQQYSQGRFYWLLISSSFRTYQFLPTFWQKFYPRYNAVTPPTYSALTDFLCWNQFQHHYDQEAGIIRLAQPQSLCGELRQISSERLRDPHIAFFLQRNPGYGQGDELVCLTEITEANLTAAGQRMWNPESPLAVPTLV